MILFIKSTLRLQIIIAILLFKAVRDFKNFFLKVITASNNNLAYYFMLFHKISINFMLKIALFVHKIANVAKTLGETLTFLFG